MEIYKVDVAVNAMPVLDEKAAPAEWCGAPGIHHGAYLILPSAAARALMRIRSDRAGAGPGPLRGPLTLD